MQLEFLPEGSDDCPLLCIYQFTQSEADRLCKAFISLSSGEREEIAVHEMPGVEAVVECRLFLRRGSKDRGLLTLTDTAAFECILSSDGWKDVAGLTEPFAEGSKGFQWLTTIGDVNWLLSTDGKW